MPRHPERFDEVADAARRSGVAWQRRSAARLCRRSRRPPSSRGRRQIAGGSVLLVDTIGELGAWWGAAAIGFVGGSFGSRGGQNMLEPAAYGVATCFGPNTWNFRDIVAQLLAADGAVVVRDAAEFEAFVRRALDDPAWAVGAGRAGAAARAVAAGGDAADGGVARGLGCRAMRQLAAPREHARTLSHASPLR